MVNATFAANIKPDLMKLLYTFCAIALTVTAFGQNLADRVGGLTSNHVVAMPEIAGPFYVASATPPVVSDSTLVCDNGDTIYLPASGGACKYLWWSTPTGGSLLGSDSIYDAGVISANTTYYVSAACGDTAIQMGLPTQSGTFSSSVRGYWFIAPKDFFITGIRVPTDASSGIATCEILKFDSIPPVYSLSTNNFTRLGRYVDNTTNMIPVCFAIDSGDVIGIYGNRSDVNSYGAAPHNTTIDGAAVTLGRSGMQMPISTNLMQNVWQEVGGSISRVELYYSVTADTSVRVPLNVVAPQSFNDTIHHTICVGDTFMFGGTPLTTAGIYTDSLQTAYNCDSVPILDLTVDPCTGIEEASALSFGLYPNPVKDQLTLQFGAGVNMGDFDVLIVDATGRLIDVKSTIVGTSPLRINLSTEHLNAGMYFVNVRGSSETRIRKFIKD